MTAPVGPAVSDDQALIDRLLEVRAELAAARTLDAGPMAVEVIDLAVTVIEDVLDELGLWWARRRRIPGQLQLKDPPLP
jgi:hypothetical protein